MLGGADVTVGLASPARPATLLYLSSLLLFWVHLLVDIRLSFVGFSFWFGLFLKFDCQKSAFGISQPDLSSICTKNCLRKHINYQQSFCIGLCLDE